MRRETWVLVTDAADARLFRADRSDGRLELLREERNERGRAKGRDLLADRPGRTFDSSGLGGRHAMEPDTDPRRVERHRFALHLAAELDTAASAGKYDALVIVAPPAMIGELRGALSSHVTERLEHEIAKDLAGFDLPELEARLADLLRPG